MTAVYSCMPRITLSVPPQGLAFRLKQTIVGAPGKGIVASHVVGSRSLSISLPTEAWPPITTAPKDRDQCEAMEFLTDLLAAGRQPAKEVQEVAKDHMITPITLRRARERMGVLDLA